MIVIIINNNSDFLCMIVSDMTLHNFYGIWLVSAYFAFETIVQIHVGSKCDSLFFCHIRKYKYKMYKKILSSIGKGPSETGWSDSYDKELCEFSVLLWFLICNRGIRLRNLYSHDFFMSASLALFCLKIRSHIPYIFSNNRA